MKMDLITCQLCGTKFQIARYGDGKCPGCSSKYEYGEDHLIDVDAFHPRADLNVIRVWVCLGRFGWNVPWPKWHLANVYPQPPDDRVGKYLYVFSRAGQDGEQSGSNVDPAGFQAIPWQMYGWLDADAYIGYGNEIDWDRLLDAIREGHAAAKAAGKL